MLQLGKTHVLGRELERVEICGSAEVRWEGQGHFTTLEGHTIVYSGGKTSGQQGVGVWIHKRRAGALIGYEPINSRILLVRIKAKPRCLSLIQVYAPTSVSEEEVIEQFYQELADTVKKVPTKDIVMVMGDFNAKVGKLSSTTVTRPGGLGEINSAGESMLEHRTQPETGQHMVQTSSSETVHMDLTRRQLKKSD